MKIQILIFGIALCCFSPCAFAQVYKCEGKWTTSPCEGEPSKTILSRTEDPEYLKKEKEVTVKYRSSPVDVTTYIFTATPESSSVRGFWYHSFKKHLVINLTGTNYQYCDVPADVVEELKKADSKGSFYNEQLKGKYQCEEEAEEEEKEVSKEQTRCTVRDLNRVEPTIRTMTKYKALGGVNHRYSSDIFITGQGDVELYLSTEELSLTDDVTREQKKLKVFRLPECGGEERYFHRLTMRTGTYTYTVVNSGKFKGCEKAVPCQN